MRPAPSAWRTAMRAFLTKSALLPQRKVQAIRTQRPPSFWLGCIGRRLMLAGHASLRDPYNPQGMIDQHALAKLTVEATAKIDHADTIDYCIGEAFRQLKAKK